MFINYTMAWFNRLPTYCTNFLNYKGIREPKCSGGDGCKVCWKIYYIKHDQEK